MLSPLATGISAGLGAAAVLGLAAGGCAYAAMWPDSQIFGATLIAPPRPGELALTFDDGPNPAWTPRLLDLLASHGVHATFFVAAGHLIGNHSWSHPNLALASSSRIEEELVSTTLELEQIASVAVRHFRPPFGARRPEVLRESRRLGMVPVLWNAMTSDWKNPSADAIASRLTQMIDRQQRHGYAANIVLHDGGHRDAAAKRAPSIAAAAQLIDRYKQSHRFVTVDAWG